MAVVTLSLLKHQYCNPVSSIPMSPYHLCTCTLNINLYLVTYCLLVTLVCFAALDPVSSAAIRLSIPSLERLGAAVTAEQVTSFTNGLVS